MIGIEEGFADPSTKILLADIEPSYSHGDILSQRGLISPIIDGEFVTVHMFDPENNIVITDQFSPLDFSEHTTEIGSATLVYFFKEYELLDSILLLDGAYIVKYTYMGQSAEISFLFTSESISNSNSIILDSVTVSIPGIKDNYLYDDILRLIGFVTPVTDNQYVTLQIFDPSNNLVVIDQFLPQEFEEFSSNHEDRLQVWFLKKYDLSGPLWLLDGMYALKISYLEQSIQKSFSFTSKSSSPDTFQSLQIDDPTTKPTLPFVDPDKDPQSYVDRYNNEESYKEWFDENYSDYTIEEAVGYEQVIEKVPSWLKYVAGWWVDDLVSENDFLDSIKYLIEEEIIETEWIDHN